MALRDPETQGMWAGTTAKERRQWRSKLSRDERADATTSVDTQYSVMADGCGTYGGAQGHRKRGELVCDRCKAARADYMRELRRRKAAS
jgi:hypothetical protein